MANKVLLLGNGFIGQRLAKELHWPVAAGRIRSFQDVQNMIKRYRPKTIINCIGGTGARNVDDCEREPDKTIHSNAFVPLLLAEGALRNKIKLVHISSGCIYHYDYQKDQPITELKTPDYFDLYYSRTKIYSEQALGNLARQFNILIPRIRIPLDDQPHPRNILTKLLKFDKVLDIPNSLTYIPDFIDALRHLMRIDARGIYNVVNRGSLRYPKLLEAYQKYRPGLKFKTMSYRQLGMKRTNLILSCRKLEQSGFKVRPINAVLDECVKRYLTHPSS